MEKKTTVSELERCELILSLGYIRAVLEMDEGLFGSKVLDDFCKLTDTILLRKDILWEVNQK